MTESEGRWSRQASLGGDLGHQKGAPQHGDCPPAEGRVRRPRVGAAGSLGHVGGRRAGGRGKALWVHAKGRSVAGDQTDLPFGGKRVRGTTTGSRGTAGQRVPPPGGRCPWPGPGWQWWAGQRETTGRGVEGVVRDRRVAQVPVRSHGRAPSAPRQGAATSGPTGGRSEGLQGCVPKTWERNRGRVRAKLPTRS